ncbi:MAG TPA: EamA family transporter [Desulfobacteraceae bacterium]|nr:EamA family transporter [Desulfobacteraceae bacterium]
MLGSVFALSSAFFWALAVILFKKAGNTFSPISLNIYKSVVAFVLIGITMVILGIPFFPDVGFRAWGLLILSGFVGITLADICFFTALNRLGAGMVAVVECLYLPNVLLFSFLLLDERLGTMGIIGSMLVLCAVAVGSLSPEELNPGELKPDELKPGGENDGPQLRDSRLSGIIAGILAMIFLALGIVMIKDVLEQTDVFWATLVRVTSGCITLSAIVFFHPRRRQYISEFTFSRSLLTALPASVIGNYVALLFWVAGMKYTTASRAGTLNQMSTIFIFIMAAILLKERITKQKLIAICMAVTGAYLTMFS